MGPQSKSVLEMARSAVMERAGYEMTKMMDNIAGPIPFRPGHAVITI